MTRTYKILGFLLVTFLGLYGCTKVPSTEKSGSEKHANLQAKAQRLEEDYRAVAAARDQFRQKLLAAEERHAQLQQQLEKAQADAAIEREALKAEVKSRTLERDAVVLQYEAFRKSLRDLLDQAESSRSYPGSPVSPSIPQAPAPSLVGHASPAR
jgi:hypothetical protein